MFAGAGGCPQVARRGCRTALCAGTAIQGSRGPTAALAGETAVVGRVHPSLAAVFRRGRAIGGAADARLGLD